MLPAITVGPVKVFSVEGAIAWSAGLAIDADGSPRAYSSHGSGLPALDYLANAGSEGHWYGLVCATDGTPIVQGPSDLAPGFFISPTSLVDKSRPIGDSRRYVDAGSVAYIAIPPEFHALGARMGDVALVTYRDRTSAAIVADSGPRGRIGEGSIALAEALGIPSSPKNGGVGGGVAVVLFAGSALSCAWPREPMDIEAQVASLFAAWGGPTRLTAALQP